MKTWNGGKPLENMKREQKEVFSTLHNEEIADGKVLNENLRSGEIKWKTLSPDKWN